MQGVSAIQSLPRQLVFSHKITLRKIFIAGFCLVALLLTSYIFQVIKYTKAGFSVSQYESQIAQVTKETRSLEDSFSNASSLPNLDSLVNNMGYQDIGTIHYIEMAGNQVATNSR